MVGQQSLVTKVLQNPRAEIRTQTDQYQITQRNDRICYADPTTLSDNRSKTNLAYQPLEYSW